MIMANPVKTSRGHSILISTISQDSTDQKQFQSLEVQQGQVTARPNTRQTRQHGTAIVSSVVAIHRSIYSNRLRPTCNCTFAFTSKRDLF
jgi:hypothetical protein